VTGDGDRDGPGDATPKDEHDDRPELDVDAAFAAIVAEFGRPAEGGVGPWPAAEDIDDDAPDEPAGGTSGPEPGTGKPGKPGGPVAPAQGTAGGAAEAARRAARRGPRHRLTDGTSLPGDEPGSGAYEAHEPDDDRERFVPPEAPPITSTDLVSRLAWLGVLGGPLCLLVAALISHALPAIVVLLTLAAFIGGFVTLVLRLPRDRGDDGDDGAVV
jgi:hypothetical protein